MNFCLPIDLTKKFLSAIRSGEINPDKMLGMTSSERRAFLSDIVGPENAKEVNALFESKILLKDQKRGLVTWAKQVAGLTPEVRKDIISKIEKLDKVLDPADEKTFLEDLAAQKLGTDVTFEEAKKITELSKEVQEEQKKGTNELGFFNMEYYKKKQVLQDYFDSLNPSSKFKVFTSVIGRGMMLSRPSSIIMNIEGNTVNALLEAFNRRVSSKEFTGFNGKLARDWIKQNIDIFNKTGYDASRGFALDKEKIRGENITHSQGKGITRSIGRLVDDIVFKKAQGIPDVAFASIHFADSINLLSSQIAAKEGLRGAAAKVRAAELFKDSVQEKPKTELGSEIRAQAEQDAQYATYTNDMWGSKVSVALRNVFNSISGDLRLGDLNIPFAKTAGNVISQGIETAGGGIVKSLFNFKEAWQEVRETGSTGKIRSASRMAVRSGIGIVVAYLIAHAVKPENFVGAWPSSKKEQEKIQKQGGLTNAIKIGNKWVSLEYFGPLGPAVTGFLYAKKYGKSAPDKFINYLEGTASGLLNLPGIAEVKDAIDYLGNLSKSDVAKKGETEASSVGGKALKTIVDFAKSRVVPGFANDILKVLLYKKPWLEQILFGSRVSEPGAKTRSTTLPRNTGDTLEKIYKY